MAYKVFISHSTRDQKLVIVLANILAKFGINVSVADSPFLEEKEEIRRKTLHGYISEEDIITEMSEHDFMVRMPPKKRYTIELDVKNIRKGNLRIVEPEGF